MSDARQRHPQSSRTTTPNEAQRSVPRPLPPDFNLDRVIADTLPSAPYLLRLEPQSAQARYSNTYWQRDTPFTADEEELQYLTFIPDHHGSLLRAHGNWDDGNGGIAPPEDPSSRTSSGRTSQAGQVVKKKITLADYKNRDKSKKQDENAITSAAKVPEGSAGSKPAAEPLAPRSTNGDVAQGSAQRSTENPPQESIHPLFTKTHEATPDVPPDLLLKKPIEQSADEPTKDRQPSSTRKQIKTPEKMLAVDKEAKATASETKTVVDPIVPPLPVADESRKRSVNEVVDTSIGPAAKRLRRSPSPSKADTDGRPQSTTNGIPPLLSPTLPSDALNSSYDDTIPELLSPTLPSECEAELASLEKKNERQLLDKKRRMTDSKITILKIKNRANRKQLSQYLKLKATPHTLSHYFPGISYESGQTDSHIAVKSAADPRPATPVGPSRGVTPNTAGRSGESPERQKWVSKCKKSIKQFVDLGTQLKHDSDAIFKSPRPDAQLGVMVAIESVFSFMLAASINDEVVRTSNQVYNTDLWKSIPFFIEYIAKNHARPFQYLYGLLNQLLAIINDTVHYLIDSKLHAVYRDYGRSKGTGTPLEFDDPEEFHSRKLPKMLRELYQASTRARSAWSEGMIALWHTDIAKNFPKTFAKQRDHSGPGKGKEPVDIDDLAKNGFSLPLSTCTTGLESVIFGLSMLTEHSKQENLAWKRKLKL